MNKAHSFKVLYIVLLCLKDIADFRGGKKLSARRIRPLIAKYCIQSLVIGHIKVNQSEETKSSVGILKNIFFAKIRLEVQTKTLIPIDNGIPIRL